MFIRWMFSEIYSKDDDIQLICCIIAYLIILIAIFKFLDETDYILTPDWILSSVVKFITGKFKHRQFAKHNHLFVKPITILEEKEH